MIANAKLKPQAALFTLRQARLVDAPVLKQLIKDSIRGAAECPDCEAHIERALAVAFGADAILIRDGTLSVAEASSEIIGCGAWAMRDLSSTENPPALLDPLCDAARMAMLYTRPDWLRNGVGRAMLERCEDDALAHAFVTAELLSPATARGTFAALGYAAGELYPSGVAEGFASHFVLMKKELI